MTSITYVLAERPASAEWALLVLNRISRSSAAFHLASISPFTADVSVVGREVTVDLPQLVPVRKQQYLGLGPSARRWGSIVSRSKRSAAIDSRALLKRCFGDVMRPRSSADRAATWASTAPRRRPQIAANGSHFVFVLWCSVLVVQPLPAVPVERRAAQDDLPDPT